jgi:hypothetical protein
MALADAEHKPVPSVKNINCGRVALKGVSAYEQMADSTTRAVSLGFESAMYGPNTLFWVAVVDPVSFTSLGFTSKGICSVVSFCLLFDVTSSVQLRAFAIFDVDKSPDKFEMN